MYASIKDIDADEMKRQLDAVGLTPTDIITKLMQDPPLAAAFQKPNVQRAIFEARDNPLAAMRYQDDPEVMMVGRVAHAEGTVLLDQLSYGELVASLQW